MSHPINTIIAENRRDRFYEKNEVRHAIPSKYLVSGQLILSDDYLKELMDKEWENELKAINEDIY